MWRRRSGDVIKAEAASRKFREAFFFDLDYLNFVCSSMRAKMFGDGGMDAGETIRIAHFSDIHVTARPLGWRMRDFLSNEAPAG